MMHDGPAVKTEDEVDWYKAGDRQFVAVVSIIALALVGPIVLLFVCVSSGVVLWGVTGHQWLKYTFFWMTKVSYHKNGSHWRHLNSYVLDRYEASIFTAYIFYQLSEIFASGFRNFKEALT